MLPKNKYYKSKKAVETLVYMVHPSGGKWRNNIEAKVELDNGLAAHRETFFAAGSDSDGFIIENEGLIL